MRELIDPTKQAMRKREAAVRYVDGKTQVFCVNFAGTIQEYDITKRVGLEKDYSTGTYPYRFKVDNKVLDSNERKVNKLPEFDFSDEKAILKAVGKKHSFDMPLWFVRKAGDSISNILKYDKPLIFQSKGCNLHDWTAEGGCTYCYVEDTSNDPTNTQHSVWLGADNILDTVERLRQDSTTRGNLDMHRIRHSGGEPTVELDLTLDIMKGIEQRGLDNLYSQFDTNLSTGKFIDQMIKEGKYPKDILEQLAAYGVCVYAAFKGSSNENIEHNTQASLTVDDQIETLGRLVDAGLEVYPCIYNPDWKTFPGFLDKLESNFKDASKMLRVEAITWRYKATQKRIECMAAMNGVTAEEMLQQYEEEEKENYDKCEEIMQFRLMNQYALPYKRFDRTQFKIERK